MTSKRVSCNILYSGKKKEIVNPPIQLMKIFKNQKSKDYYRNYTLLFLLGTLNNLYYVVVGSSAKNLSLSFNAERYLGFITWANVAFGLVARSVNTWALEKVEYKYRNISYIILTALGLLGLAISHSFNFGFAIGSIVIIGAMSSFGESVMLGYLKNGYAPEIVGAWSSGTGMSGVLGSLLYLFFVFLKLKLETVWMILIPSTVLYGVCFYFLKPDPNFIKSAPGDIEPTEESSRLLGDSESSIQYSATDRLIGDMEPGKAAFYPVSKWERNKRSFKLVFGLAANLFMVYFFEYIISAGFAAKSLTSSEAQSKKVLDRDSYEILAFAYQLGVFVSRSSLSLIKIPYITVLTIFQAANFVLWLFLAIYKFIPMSGQIWLMIFVGLLGGASYVNIFYILLNDDKYAKDLELNINLVALCITAGITFAAVFILISFNTFLLHS